MTAALVGVRVVVIEGLSDPTGAHVCPWRAAPGGLSDPWAIGLRAPLLHSDIGDDEPPMRTSSVLPIAKRLPSAVEATIGEVDIWSSTSSHRSVPNASGDQNSSPRPCPGACGETPRDPRGARGRTRFVR